MASRPSRFLKGPVAVTCTIALASALSLPPVALAASDGSSLDAGEARITLQSNGRMLKFDQALINQVGLQHTGGSCLGYAAAYAKTITTGTVHTWAEFDYNGGAYGESGFCGKNMTDEFDCRVIGSESEVLRTLYNAINDGHPVVLYVTTGSGSQHWVTVIGYEGVDNPDNLSTDNFIILDPDRTSGLEPESLSSRGLTLRYGDWFVDSGVVDYVFDHGYITGYAGTTLFGPANGLRRSEAVTILWRVAGKPQVASEKPQFDDADYEDFYGQALTWAREVGVVNGWDGTNDFAPDMEVSREQLAKMIANYANKIAGANTVAGQSNLDIFDDADAISPWARDAVAWCAQAGVLTGSPANGSNNALPQFVANRAATAKMVTVLARDVLALG